MNSRTWLKDSPLILVVDDDLPTRIVSSDMLAAQGFQVMEADSGEEALRLFEAHKPDAVLLDVMMPGLDGFETCERLRRLPGGDTCPVIIVTGLLESSTLERAFEAGASDFATKPISWLALSHRLRHLVRSTELVGRLRDSEAMLARAQSIAGLGHWELDLNSGRLALSEQTLKLLGTPPREGVSGEWYLSQCHPAERRQLLRALVSASRSSTPSTIEHQLRSFDGSYRHVELNLELLAAETKSSARIVGTLQDVTKRKNDEEQIRRLAYFDSLTDLPNRAYFSRFLASTLASARRRRTSVAVIFLDLDDFKNINDTLGHSVGDLVLKEVSQRLLTATRITDAVVRAHDRTESDTVARLGGDEFIIALVDVLRAEDTALVARRILTSLQAPIVVDDREMFISGSIGISLYPQDGETVDDLLKHADLAMYHAKDNGKNDFRFYSQSLNAAAFQRLSLESQLRKALERNELSLFVQPKLDVRSGKIVGGEALLRWIHPDLGIVPPDHFIPVAEETGLIVPIGNWVVHEAVRILRTWLDAGFSDLGISINISGSHFLHSSLMAEIRAAVMTSGVPAEQLEIEVTESVLMKDASAAVGMLHDLKAMGLRLSVDDFGTGYSSLAYLKRFPLDVLKIDRSFVRDLEHSSDDRVICEVIIGLAQRLGLDVIAEGVETAGQRQFLSDQGCFLMQGYLFGRPIPTRDFFALLERSATVGAVATSTKR